MALYRKKQLQELIDWTPDLPMALVSISDADKANGSPKEGDKIAFNPKDPTDMWLVAEHFFKDNYEWVADTATLFVSRPIEQEIALCQRYYDKIFNKNTS